MLFEHRFKLEILKISMCRLNIELNLNILKINPNYILTHTSNAKFFRKITLINKRGLAEIIVPIRGYGRDSPNQVMLKRE